MTTECPECGGTQTSTINHAGPAGSAIVKCFGDCDGERHEVDSDVAKSIDRTRSTSANKQQKESQATLTEYADNQQEAGTKSKTVEESSADEQQEQTQSSLGDW